MSSTWTKSPKPLMHTKKRDNSFTGDVWFQFVPGVVVEVVNSKNSFSAQGQSSLTNTIIAKPHIYDTPPPKNAQILNDPNYRYKPLLRGIVDCPAKGDPILLCTFGGNNYYLGPLNTDNNVNFNEDNLFKPENLPLQDILEKNNPKVTIEILRGQSETFIKERARKRLSKILVPDLDAPVINGMRAPITETHGDLMLEGRHGNSVRVGSRHINPYIILSNGRSSHNDSETLGDGSVISLTHAGSLLQHFGSVMDTNHIEIPGFILSSDIIENERRMASVIKTVNPVEDINGKIYKYSKNQILIRSGRVTLDSKSDDMYLSSINDIHIGTGRHLTISSNKNVIMETKGFNIGDPNKETYKNKMEPFVLGKQLDIILKKLFAIIKGANALVQGAAVPLVDGGMSPIAPKITELEDELILLLSQNHFIEPNEDKEETSEDNSIE